jgi:hypothetical protein
VTVQIDLKTLLEGGLTKIGGKHSDDRGSLRV